MDLWKKTYIVTTTRTTDEFQEADAADTDLLGYIQKGNCMQVRMKMPEHFALRINQTARMVTPSCVAYFREVVGKYFPILFVLKAIYHAINAIEDAVMQFV